MRAVRQSGNKSTERRLRGSLIASGLTGWAVDARSVEGRPDFFFCKERVAVFVDGCFWHGCLKCGHLPTKNRTFWATKISQNKNRDAAVRRRLQRSRVAILRFWEHEVAVDPRSCVLRIAEIVMTRRRRRAKRTSSRVSAGPAHPARASKQAVDARRRVSGRSA